MRIYIDLFFLFNTIMDIIIITSVSILLKRNTTYKRILISSLLGGISSLMLFTSINRLLLELITIILMVTIAFKYKNIRYFLTNILYTYILSILLGGLIYLFNSKVTLNIYLNYLVIIILSIEVMTLYIKESKKIKNTYNNYYKVDIYFKDKEKISLIGFLDTGNNLYDPYKKRPIILVDKKYQKEDKFILVPYHTINGEGLLKCIKPEKVYIEKIGYKTNLLVAFSSSPSTINGVEVLLHKDLMKG
ncbi:MAG: sigma-E processing peptidase SpoIIGA [Bacilli bacterium]|nr:sigma-E processing peptidase SpoIIGA [Bacilli bacterium]